MMLQQDIPTLPYHFNAALLADLLGLTALDDWPAAGVANVFSENGSHFVQIARAENADRRLATPRQGVPAPPLTECLAVPAAAGQLPQ